MLPSAVLTHSIKDIKGLLHLRTEKGAFTLAMYKYVIVGLQGMFPDIEKIFKLLLTIPLSNACIEMSFFSTKKCKQIACWCNNTARIFLFCM
jgi:hypothetical protein